MASRVCNVAKGKWKYYAELPAASDSLIVVLFKDAVQADDTLDDHTTLAQWTAANTEANFTNYARQTVAGVSATVNNTTNESKVTGTSPIVFSNAGGAVNNDLTKALICYKPDSGSADSAIIPLAHLDLSVTTNGTNLNLVVHAEGLIKATQGAGA